MADISNIRKDFTQNSSLSKKEVPQDPLVFFEQWFNETRKNKQLAEPNGFVLSTINQAQQINSRTVLLKYFDENGFVFFTNYHSQKAQDIDKNPSVNACFPWYVLERQVIIKGIVEKISANESHQYFMSRPRESQIGAWVSEQSQVIASRKILLDKLTELQEKFDGQPVPYPKHWGGYRIVPSSIEFWQGQPSRLHDRLVYKKSHTTDNNSSWQIDRLSP